MWARAATWGTVPTLHHVAWRTPCAARRRFPRRGQLASLLLGPPRVVPQRSRLDGAPGGASGGRRRPRRQRHRGWTGGRETSRGTGPPWSRAGLGRADPSGLVGSCSWCPSSSSAGRHPSQWKGPCGSPRRGGLPRGKEEHPTRADFQKGLAPFCPLDDGPGGTRNDDVRRLGCPRGALGFAHRPRDRVAFVVSSSGARKPTPVPGMGKRRRSLLCSRGRIRP